MKAFFTLFILSCIGLLPLSAQQYYVLSVTGDVTADGKALQKKDKLTGEAELRFGSPNAFVYVIAPGKGYYILSGKKSAAAGASEIVVALKEALLPPNEYYTTSTKSGALRPASSFVNAGQVRAFFNGPVLLITPATFQVDPATFPLDEQHYFQLTHSLPEGTVTRKLPGSEGRFHIDESIYQAEAGNIDPALVQATSLSYIDEAARNRLPLGTFELHLLSKERMLEELALLHEAVAPVAPNIFLMEHARPYLQHTYGETDWNLVRRLIEEHFGPDNE